MSTFYGGEQIASIFTLSHSSSSTVSDLHLYTVPSGHVACIQITGGVNFSVAGTVTMRLPPFPDRDIAINGSSDVFNHPNNTTTSFYDSGTQVLITHVTNSGTTYQNFMIYLYKKP